VAAAAGAGEQTSTCELLAYDARGVRSYQRFDAIRDPHDVVWFEGAPHVSASWDDAVWRVDPGRRAPPGVAGLPGPGCLARQLAGGVDGASHVCAFGRGQRHKSWKVDQGAPTGFVHDLRAGRDVLTGLAHPHTPRRRGDQWFVCESSTGSLAILDADGELVRRVAVHRFTRGLAFAGRWALVGGNAHREHDDDRAEVVVVDLDSSAVVERIPMPCLEVYDILVVPPAVVRGAAVGFGANARPGPSS
jgi:hypothetical protein